MTFTAHNKTKTATFTSQTYSQHSSAHYKGSSDYIPAAVDNLQPTETLRLISQTNSNTRKLKFKLNSLPTIIVCTLEGMSVIIINSHKRDERNLKKKNDQDIVRGWEFIGVVVSVTSRHLFWCPTRLPADNHQLKTPTTAERFVKQADGCYTSYHESLTNYWRSHHPVTSVLEGCTI